jgi:hypothetical protein
MLRNNSDMPKTLKNQMVSDNPRPYPTLLKGGHAFGLSSGSLQCVDTTEAPTFRWPLSP